MADTTLQVMGRIYDKLIVDPLRTVLIGKELIPFTAPAGMGISNVNWNIAKDMSDGKVSFAFDGGNEDEIGFTPNNKNIPFYWKDYIVERGMYEAFKAKGVALDASNAIGAAYKAAKTMDSTLLVGAKFDETNYTIDGLYNGATSEYSTSSNMATAGVPTTMVAGAQNVLELADVPTSIPMNLVLNPVQANKLRPLRSTNGVREMPEVLEMLNGGKIYSTSQIPTTTGLLLPAASVAQPFFDYYTRVDWRTELGLDSKHPDTGPINGRVYCGGILRIKQPLAICKLSALV